MKKMFKSLYPSLMGEFNIAPNTQIGKIEIREKVYDGENAYHIEPEKYSRGGEFIENLVTDNHIEFCHRWFKLANVEEMIEDVDEYYNRFGFGKYSNLISAGYGSNYTEGISPVLPTASRTANPVTFRNPKVNSPVIFHTPRSTEYTYYNLIQEARAM